MNHYPKISIITPCFNDVLYIERTILSIIEQSYPNLEYIIIDGGSTDGSVDIIKKYADKLTYWVSEKDKGMYDALEKGFKRSTGEIMGWINSDDKHHPGALFTLAQVFTDFPKINWLQGTPNVIDDTDRIVYASHNYEIDRFFFYQHRHIHSHKYIQQESTFWRRTLWDKAGSHISEQYKYAGDFELWIRFFQFEKLFLVPALLGAFRQCSSGQASLDHYKEYADETIQILKSYPLDSRSAGIQKSYRFIHAIERKFRKLFFAYRKRFNLHHNSVVDGSVTFDPVSQKFLMR